MPASTAAFAPGDSVDSVPPEGSPPFPEQLPLPLDLSATVLCSGDAMTCPCARCASKRHHIEAVEVRLSQWARVFRQPPSRADDIRRWKKSTTKWYRAARKLYGENSPYGHHPKVRWMYEPE